MNMVKNMLKKKNTYGLKLYQFLVYLLDMYPKKRLKGGTPKETLLETKSNVNHLKCI